MRKKRKAGQPTKGVTLATSIRLPVALDRKIERIRRRGAILRTETQALERALRKEVEIRRDRE